MAVNASRGLRPVAPACRVTGFRRNIPLGHGTSVQGGAQMRALFLAATLVTGGAAAEERMAVWSGWAEGGQGGAVDCTDCYEDEYVGLSCERAGESVAMALVGLVPGQDGSAAPLEVQVDIDGQAETRRASLEHSEMFGAIPVLVVPEDDPLLARLRAGATLTLSTRDDRLAIPLAGAAQALDTMFSACR